MNFSFIEWIENKKEMIQESAGRLRAQQSYDWTPQISQEDIENGVNHWVITNSGKFLKDVIKMPNKTELENNPNASPELLIQNPNPLDYSLFKIKEVDGDTVYMERPEDKFNSIRDKKRSYAKGASHVSSIDQLVDVTDTFQEMGIGNADIKNKYFIDKSKSTMNRKRPEAFDKRLKAYMNLTRVQAGGDDERDLGMKNLLGGEDAVKGALNKGANDIRDKMWKDFSRKIEAGMDVSQELRQALHDEERGSLLDNPRFVKKLQIIGAGNIVQYAKWNNLHGSLDSNERSLVKNLQRLEQIIASGMLEKQPDLFDNNQEIESILNNPEAPYAAHALGLKNVLMYMKQNSADQIFQKMQRQRPQPTASQAAQDFASQFGKAESFRGWRENSEFKYLNESKKFFKYYPKD